MAERKVSEASRHAVPGANFPTHNSPRVWLITQPTSPLAIRLIRQLLAHGDFVVACVPPEATVNGHSDEYTSLLAACRQRWHNRMQSLMCDNRKKSEISAAIAQAIATFGHIDILLCCNFEAVVGTVEELSTTPATQSLFRDQFETIYFSQLNFIKGVLPHMRERRNGHIVVLSNTGGHIATPGLASSASATWALEGFCDSLMFEIAPFSIKVTIVQPQLDIQLLTNKITFAPHLPSYDSTLNPAPSMRDILSRPLNAFPETAVDPSATEIQDRHARLAPEYLDKVLQETVHALIAIGGHENPPTRHIVGAEAASAVQEKLATVTHELEDFLDASLAVDVGPENELMTLARRKQGQEPEQEGQAPQPSEAGESSII